MKVASSFFLDFDAESYFRLIEDFKELQQRCPGPQQSHHCGHYSSFLRDFVVFTEEGLRSGRPMPRNALGSSPLGVWPTITLLYSSQCPIVSNYFGTANSIFKQYLEKHSLKLLGLTFALRDCANGKNYFLAVILGKLNSSNMICTNCTQNDCRETHRIDEYARSLHCRHL